MNPMNGWMFVCAPVPIAIDSSSTQLDKQKDTIWWKDCVYFTGRCRSIITIIDDDHGDDNADDYDANDEWTGEWEKYCFSLFSIRYKRYNKRMEWTSRWMSLLHPLTVWSCTQNTCVCVCVCVSTFCPSRMLYRADMLSRPTYARSKSWKSSCTTHTLVRV